MAVERISSIASWLKRELDRYRELQRFNKFFRGNEKTNGILTKPSEEVNPLTLGLITARNSFPIIKNYLLGDPLSEEEQQRVKHAILFSLRGNYDINPLPVGEGVRIGITLENNDAQTYLSRNINNSVAFLRYWDGKREQHKESSSIMINQENHPPQIVLNFLQTNEVPPKHSRLYLYTRPASIEDIDRRFTRMILFLKA